MSNEYTVEQVENGIASGDLDIINNVASGNYTIMEEGLQGEPTEEVVGAELTHEESPVEEIPAVDEGLEQMQRDIELASTKLREAEEAKKAEVEAERRRAQELERKLEESERRYKEANEKPVEQVKFELPNDSEDEEFADNFSKNTRNIVKDLTGKVATTDQLQLALDKIAALEAESKEREDSLKEQRDEESRKAHKRSLFTEVENFQKANAHFETPAPIEDMFGKATELRKRLKDFIKSEDSSEVEKAYYSAIVGKTDKDERLRAELTKAGVEIPEGIQEFQKLADIVDLKNGRQYNRITGKYDEILDNYGNLVVQRSVADAYKLSTYAERITEAAKNASREIQHKLETRSNSAVVMDNDSTTTGETGLSEDAISKIMGMSPKAIKANPEFMKMYNQAMTQMGLAH